MDKRINDLQKIDKVLVEDMIAIYRQGDIEAKHATQEQVLEFIRSLIALDVIAQSVAYKGIATPASNPGAQTTPAFWIATQAGAYPNYGGVVVPVGSFSVISYTAGSFYITSVALPSGQRGWAPVFAGVADGLRVVHRLVGYVGGEGAAPTNNINEYVGSAGYVAAIANAVDFRGPQGIQGNTGTAITPLYVANQAYVHPAQVLRNGRIWRTLTNAATTDVPGSAPLVWEDATYGKRNVTDLITVADTNMQSLGKNLLNPNTTDVIEKARINVGTPGAIELNAGLTSRVVKFPVLPNQPYLLIGLTTGNRDYLFLDSSDVILTSGAAFSATNVANSPASAAKIAIEFTATDVLATIMLANSSVTIPFEAYENVLSEAALKRAVLLSAVGGDASAIVIMKPGENVFNKDAPYTANTQLNSANGQNNTNASFQFRVFDYTEISPSENYLALNTGNVKLAIYDKDYKFIQYFSLTEGASFVTTALTKYQRTEVSEAGVASVNFDLFRIQRGTIPNRPKKYRKEIASPLSINSVRDSVPGSNNRLIMPAKQYYLTGKQNSLYFQQMLSRYSPRTFHVMMTGTNLITHRGRAVTTPVSGSATQTVQLWDADWNAIAVKSFSAISTAQTVNNGALKVLAIADSWGEGMFTWLRAKELITGIENVGTRRGTASATVGYSEGKSGWLLNQDFILNKIHSTDTYYNAFMQPAEPFKYYAGTQMWKNALAGGDVTTNKLYTTAIRVGFDANTGYKANPVANDVMWSDANNRYEVYDGFTWGLISEASLGFSFQVAKYRAVYQVAMPDIVTINYALNDFRGTSPLDFPAKWRTWKTQLDAVIASAKADNPNVKFIIMLSLGCLPDEYDNKDGGYAPYLSYGMWNHREQTILNYDGRESEKIYIVDTGAVIDPEFAYRKAKVLPFEEYVTVAGYTDEMRTVYQDHVHSEPETGYRAIGVKIAAIIQAIR